MNTDKGRLIASVRIVGLLVVGAFGSGCYTTTYYTKNPRSGVSHKEWNHRWIYGLIESGDPLNADDVCHNGIAEVQTETTFVNALVGGMVQTAASLAVSIPVYTATKDAGQDYLEWRAYNNARYSEHALPQVWSPSTITVECAR